MFEAQLIKCENQVMNLESQKFSYR
eukprot:UN14836